MKTKETLKASGSPSSLQPQIELKADRGRTDDKASETRSWRRSSSMAYQALLAQMVANLEPNSADRRRVVYQRAQTALLAQIQSSEPPLAASEIEHEKRLLQEAVDAVEVDMQRRREDQRESGETIPSRQATDLGGEAGLHPRLLAMMKAGRYQGVELDPNEFASTPGESTPSAAALSQWAQNAGMWSRAVRIRWRQLLKLVDSGPIVLLFADGAAALVTGVNAATMSVQLKHPNEPAGAPSIDVDELRLSQVWGGEAVLLRAARGAVPMDALFDFRWLVDLVRKEHRGLRDIALASMTISFLTIFPPLFVMTIVNKVLQFHSVSTLVLLSAMMAVVVAYETLLGYATTADHFGDRRAARRQAQPASLQSPASLAARLFRAPSGRRDDVSDRPGLSRPRVPDRQAADDVPRPDHALRAASLPVLSQQDIGVHRAGLRRAISPDHRRFSEAAQSARMRA